MKPPNLRATPLVLAGLGAWLLLATLVSASGALRAARPPLPQVLIAVLVAGLLLVGLVPAGARRWLRSIPLARLVAIHLTRFVGVYFLVLYGAGRLPYEFAVPGGIGDVVAACGALYLLARAAAGDAPRALLVAWNAFGLLDILFVVATAGRMALARPGSMTELFGLPLALLPTFVVPLIIFSHVVIFWRVLGRAQVSAA
jgi:hypothetical protein